MRNLQSISSISLLLVLQLWACLGDAERRNPLDAQSPDFKSVGTISGRTLSYFQPFRPVADVEVSLSPGMLATRSDDQGQFVFTDVPAGEYEVRVAKPGFATVTDSVAVSLQGVSSVQFNMDALPFADSVSVVSWYVNLPPASATKLLQVYAQTDDPDGTNDVERVTFEIPGISFIDTLDIGASFGVFQKFISESEIPTSSIENLIGRRFLVTIYDGAGFASEPLPVFLTRVIATRPLPVSPTEFALLNETQPVLTWRAVSLPFDFSFRIEVVRADFGVQIPVWSQSGVSSDATSVQVGTPLAPGTYNWTVAVVDALGNLARSVESSFRINQ